MKKLLAILLILALMLCAVGCQTSENPGSDMNLESDIIKAYLAYLGPAWDLSEDELSIDSYGTYNGCTVGYINGPIGYAAVISGEKVGPYIFEYGDSQKMLAYKDGQIKSMAEAYKLGWLNDDAVKQILEKHKLEYPYMYE
jgi:hypothetical protein